MPASTTTVIYPQGAKFNMDYYLSTHMPLVESKWKQYGLKSWKVLKFPDDAPYCVQATLEWDSKEDFEKALGGAEVKEVMGDVPNFSDKEPTLLAGDVVKTS